MWPVVSWSCGPVVPWSLNPPCMPQQPDPTKACGLLVRRERWGLSWRGRLLTLILILSILGVGYRSLHPFLALTDRLTDELLIVEGWIPAYSVHLAAEECLRGEYRRLLIVRPLYEGEAGVWNGRHPGWGHCDVRSDL